MKKLLAFLLFGIVLPVQYSSGAQTKTASPSSTPTPEVEEEIDSKIQGLKERLATKVAELKKMQRRALVGKITEKEEEDFFNLQVKETIWGIILAEDAKILQLTDGKKTALDFADLEVNQRVIVFGQETIDKKELTAKVIFVMTEKIHILGTITSIDKENASLIVRGKDEKDYQVDVEVYTKTRVYNPGKGIEKSGFSKLKEDDRVFVFGEQGEKSITALRILVLSPNKLEVPTPTPKTASPSAE